MPNSPTYLGTVQDVQGATIGIALDKDTVSGLAFIGGLGYRIGQIGSFVRISIGFTDLFGIVSQIGAGAVPEPLIKAQPYDYLHGLRWMQVQLIGEGQRSGKFRRGISQYPTIGDEAHLVTEQDLTRIYGPGEPDDFVAVGHLASTEAIPSLVNINALVTRHAAVVGTTGAGKSTTVAGILSALADSDHYPSARILLLDIHGEYPKALADRCTVFRVSADETKGDRPLHIPFWALSFQELITVGFGGLDGQKAATIADYVLQLKRESLTNCPLDGVTQDAVTVDSPVPFCIHKMWLDLHRREHLTVVPKPGGGSDEREPAYVLNDKGKPVQTGDAMLVTAPLYRTVKTTGKAEERVQYGADGIGIRQQLAGLASRLRDPRFNFLFRPGDWLPDLDGKTAQDLDVLLENWIGGEKPISVLDLSGIPSAVLNDLIGALLRILYDALFWARKLPEGGRERPLLVVLEEAHAYLNKDDSGAAAAAVRRIAKEGRKYGVGIMLVSQRPSDIDSTILSQCGTLFAMRLSNETDRAHVTSAASDNLKGLFNMLPVLRTGEAIIVGEAVSLPIRTFIDPPAKNRKPDSEDPRVVVRGSLQRDGFDGAGGWNQKRDIPDYAAVMRLWRKQSPHYEHIKATPGGTGTPADKEAES
ncbi:MAG: ATP-binding protein [Candidatus Brocadiia bacterium]